MRLHFVFDQTFCFLLMLRLSSKVLLHFLQHCSTTPVASFTEKSKNKSVKSPKYRKARAFHSSSSPVCVCMNKIMKSFRNQQKQDSEARLIDWTKMRLIDKSSFGIRKGRKWFYKECGINLLNSELSFLIYFLMLFTDLCEAALENCAEIKEEKGSFGVAQNEWYVLQSSCVWVGPLIMWEYYTNSDLYLSMGMC